MSALNLAKKYLTLSPDNGMLVYLAEKKLHIDVEELLKDEELMNFFTEKAPKTGLERALALSEFNEEKCQALIWQKADSEDLKGTGYSAGNTGYAVQCNTAPVGDGCFCKKHAKQESNGLLWCGLITETPPENPVKVEGNGNTKEMYWYKEEDGESSPAPSTKGQKPNKQSPPWKPAGANTEPSLEEQINAAKKKSPAKKSPAKKSPVKKKSPAKEEPEKEKKPRGRPKKKKDESPPEEEEKKPKKPKKSQAKEKVAKKSPAKEKVAKVDKELGEMDPSEMSMGQLQALMAAKKMMETVKDKDDDQLDEDNECASDDEDGLKEIDYEGIGYLMNCEMVVIDPVSMEEVGKWDTDDEEIEWIDDDAAEEHADRVANSDWNKL